MTSVPAASALKEINPQWLAPAGELPCYEVDGLTPGFAARPPSVKAMGELVRLANEEGLATIPTGGGTMRSLGNIPRRYDLAVDTRSLDHLTEYEPADLTVTVGAGMTLGRLGEILAENAQFLPLEAPAPARATVGGMLATASSGPLALTYGFPRDWLIGVKVVNADGRVTKGGGRVVKNVTGYDMNKLYTGSLGTLGIIIEASFKVAPKPPASATLLAGFVGLEGAMRGAHRLLEGYGGPAALTLVNAPIASRLGFDRNGYLLLARFLGRAVIVGGKVARATRSLAAAGASDVGEVDASQEAVLWQNLVDLPWGNSGAPVLSVRCSTMPSDVGSLLADLEGVGGRILSHGLTADVGTGLVRSISWGDGMPGDFEDKLEQVTGLMSRDENAWVIENCPRQLKDRRDVWGPLPSGLRLMRRVKLLLDPHGILNPGRFVGGI